MSIQFSQAETILKLLAHYRKASALFSSLTKEDKPIQTKNTLFEALEQSKAGAPLR